MAFFIGGPWDGKAFKMPSAKPLPYYEVAVQYDVPCLEPGDGPMARTEIFTYRLVTKDVYAPYRWEDSEVIHFLCQHYVH